MFRLRTLLLIALVAAGFICAFLSGFFLNDYFNRGQHSFSTLDEAFRILINHSYLELPEDKKLEYGMIRGMLQASGDPHASFNEPIQHELASNNLQGRYGGIGVEIIKNQDGETLIYPIKGGPAEIAGILGGDVLVSIDDLIVNPDSSMDQINAAIRGQLGSWVVVTVTRSLDSTQQEFRIKREEIHLPSVTWRTVKGFPNIGLININIIAETTPNEILNAVNLLKEEGVSQFILDLRDNGGGLLTAGVETAELFLSSGIILEQQYRGEEVETFMINTPGQLSDIPLVVLINQNTASAAEIIAGALQVQSRAKLIGVSTFGKDTVQLIFDLEDDSSLHITAAKWWIPSLIPEIGEGGLIPDILINQDDTDRDLFLEAAVQALMDG